MRRVSIFLLSAMGLALCGCAGNSLPGTGLHPIPGDSMLVNGHRIGTYAQVDDSGSVKEVVVTMAGALASDPPASMGSGPSGASAVVEFPDVVKSQTFFNHFELHWEPTGHPPAVYMTPHFDLHFYGVDVASVFAVTNPDPQAPPSQRVPAGYTYPGVNAAIPEMGTHAGPDSDLGIVGVFSKTFIYGYYNAQITFLEPMLTQSFLTAHQSWSKAVPLPQQLGRTTRFPLTFDAIWDQATGTWYFRFRNFISAQ